MASGANFHFLTEPKRKKEGELAVNAEGAINVFCEQSWRKGFTLCTMSLFIVETAKTIHIFNFDEPNLSPFKLLVPSWFSPD